MGGYKSTLNDCGLEVDSLGANPMSVSDWWEELTLNRSAAGVIYREGKCRGSAIRLSPIAKVQTSCTTCTRSILGGSNDRPVRKRVAAWSLQLTKLV